MSELPLRTLDLAAAGGDPPAAAPLSEDLVTEINARAEAMLPDVISVRRHLHRNPELSEQEFRTTEFLARLVESLGLVPTVTEARTGLTCDLLSGTAATELPPRLVLRGDIDALPLQDGKAVEYRSSCEGRMHACGHDAHPTIVYGALRLLVSLDRDGLLPWPIAIRGLFQPAEETATGAKAMIHAHALRDVAAAIALHVDPSRAVGRIGLRVGALTASCDTFRVDFVGQGGHGARPHLTRDPIEAAAAWILATYRRIPRIVDAHKTVVISIGHITGGHSPNVIPGTATLYGTLRTLSREARAAALDALEDINESIHREAGVEINIQRTQSSPTVENDRQITEMLATAATRTLGAGAIDWIDYPSMGSEDFSYYLDHVPGAMFRLGVAGDQVGCAPLHTPQFDIDERALAVGIRMMAAAAISYFAPREE
ncbi:amidohydrolase [Candidatus Laterigemmans baculatus]|uniref:amidohydrolase n=1 Tax=Candidatus Laterigemmans baculatus TaxID=2770505 RepID=UPI0013DC28E9|nr:amidohydrolase [Candidatus Laterigemmans baculatus]